MDKNQKEFVGKVVKTAQKKVQPHLTVGKGLAALGVGVVFYALANTGPSSKVADQAVDGQATAQVEKHDATKKNDVAKDAVKPAPTKNAEVDSKKVAAEATAEAKEVVKKETAKTAATSKNTASKSEDPKKAVPIKSDKVAVEPQSKDLEVTKSPQKQTDETVAVLPKSTAPKITELKKDARKKDGSEKKVQETQKSLLSNSVEVDDTAVKTSDNKTLDELSKWAGQPEKNTAKTDKAPEEQDAMGNEPTAIEEDDEALPPLIKKDGRQVKTSEGDVAEGKAKVQGKNANSATDKGVIAPENPVVSTIIEPIDKNAVTGLADAEAESPASKEGVQKKDSALAESSEAKEGQSGDLTDKKPQTGLLSAPLPKDVEAQIISKFERSAQKRKKTGLLSAPIQEDAEDTKAKEPETTQSERPVEQENIQKQGNETMNESATIKKDIAAKGHEIHKSSKTNVAEFTLNNGMEVIVIPDHRAPVVTHMVWYKVGAIDEPMGKSGIAHFLEHLMFKGTKKIKPGEFSKIIARNGGQDNAFTSMDTTAYHERVAKDRLRMVMEMEADRMRNLILSEKDVLTERDVILEERRSRTDNKPSAQFREQMESALYMNHPYGIPIIGWLHEMKTLSREDALQFYRRFYAPNNAVLVVAGDVTVEEVEKLASEIYEPIKPEKGVVRAMRAQEPPHRAARRLVMRHKRVAKAQWQRYYIAPGYANAEVGEVEALDLLFKILADSITGRLYKSMVVKDKTAENVGGYYSGDSLDSGKMVFYGIAAKGVKLAAVEAAIDKEIALVKAKGVTQAELDAARNAYSAAYIYANDNQVSLANRYGGAKVRGRTIAQVEGWPDMLKKVTIEDIQKVAQKYLIIEKSVTGELLPEETQKAETKTKADKG